ncbi:MULTISPECIES: tail assembly protein [unclassified Pseudomonas]|uniref:tail assembly protein n=1 Tax=unclassified Pseudomonas TaxID=196821 RepID=UPI001F374962|nr:MULTISPECIES: tail assembly protein [unclassified Pseudomonas]MCF5233094.1 tail assembly protein [Pseudomonas sp. PA-5-4H]MCF5237411.1 tail assembly protein [Pseudomonas sp. PA-5-4G]MCF5245975.1 tail assembly protein [Pseudomonas sp. PA-5-4B]MCF5252697.1 tail assembly protein [Pseudomonas sp. PA-5-4B]MCF5257956.1 tail assembly protein [Pseudomonas sp. PA-5-4A]
MHHEKVRTVRLYGSLGARFGRVHRLAVSNASEAIRALCILVPGFERFLMGSKDQGVTYSVFLGKDNIGQDRLKAPSGDSDIRIAPVLLGSKRAGSMQTIIGVALVVAASYFSGGLAAGGASTLIGGTSAAGWTFAANMGIALAMGGAMQMMSPQAKGLGTMDRPDNRPSYSFNGPVNTSVQGSPVGLLYGELTVGSAVISAGIYTQDQL